MKRTVRNILGGVVIALGLVTTANAALLDAEVPDNATFIDAGNGLQWAWASPLSGNVDLSFQGAFGWRVATADDLLLAPSALDFLYAGANVPLNGSDPVSNATFQFTAPTLNGPAACAAPYFTISYRHCDWGNAPGSNGSNMVAWNSDYFSESLVVRNIDGPTPDIPAPAAALLFGAGLLGLGLQRTRRKKSA